MKAEIAQEKNCKIIGINLNNQTEMDSLNTPNILKNIGAIFIPFNAKVIKHTIDNNWTMNKKDNRHWLKSVYDGLGVNI